MSAVAAIPALSGFAPAVLERGSVSRWMAGDMIWDTGDPSRGFSFLLEGRAQLVAPAEGHEHPVLAVLSRGDLLCGSAPCLRVGYCCRAIAMDDVTIYALPRDVAFEAAPPEVDVLVSALSGRGVEQCRRLRGTLRQRASERVRRLLLTLVDDRDARTLPDGRVTLPPMRRATLAGLCGLTTETVVRELTRLRRRGAVTGTGQLTVVVSALMQTDESTADSA